MRPKLRYMVVFKGTDQSPIMRMEVEFRAVAGYEEEYAGKIRRALEPAIEIDCGPWPMDLALEYVGPES